MTEQIALRRWLEDSSVPESLRQALGAATADLPSAAALEHLCARVDSIGADLPGSSPSPALGTGHIAPALKLKLLLGLAAIGGAAAVLHGFTRRPEVPELSPPTVASRTPTAPELTAVEAASAHPTPRDEPAAIEKAPTETTAPSVDERSASVRPASSLGSAKPALTEEQLLRQAQVALRSDPARALRLTERHGREFPRGVLGQEREVITIQALKAVGRDAEARRRALAFEKRFPNSAHRNKIRSIARVP